MTANLMVNSVDDSVRFYNDILGFSVTVSVPNESGSLQFALMTRDEQNIMFQEKNNLMAEYPILSTNKVSPSITIYIMVDNFQEVYDSIKGKHSILCDIHETFYGSKEFAIADNNGYVLTFTEHK